MGRGRIAAELPVDRIRRPLGADWRGFEGAVCQCIFGPSGNEMGSINVVDEGPGVPRDTGERMFEPFQRLGDQDNTSGVGLGLSVARGFVEAMGGTVTATDTPGGGLTMVVELASAQ